MYLRIRDMLDAIEREEDVRILYACESGSRAWGFASQDSDWDVRFLYARRANDYFAVDSDTRRDVVERPIVDLLDVNGWDLKKALQLLQRSNPALLEWLQSPIVYSERCETRTALAPLVSEWYAPEKCRLHYLSMARSNYREYLQGAEVRTKKYLYALRPLLALRWIESEAGPPPTEFQPLVERFAIEPRLRTAIDELLAKKRDGAELDSGPRIDALNEFIEAELARADRERLAAEAPHPDVEPMNAVFRDLVARAWSA